MSQASLSAEAFFRTSDLNLASFLRCRGFTIQELAAQGSRTIFAFADAPELRRAILEFANDGSVGVRSFCSAVRDLKAITRSGGRHEEV